MRIQLDTFGLPIFTDNKGRELPHPDGLIAFMDQNHLTAGKLAEKIGLSARTVEGYRQGKPITATSMVLINYIWGNNVI